MTWPPNSPDLSPIENVWAHVDGKVQAKGCKTFAEFKQTVLEELEDFPLSLLKKLCDSMGNRVAMVLASEGGKTRY